MKHMNLEHRETIEIMLKEQKSFTEISNAIGYHRTTISDEIIKHRIKSKTNTFNTKSVNCKLEDTCELFHGINCTHKCVKYIEKECINTTKAPYVCNGCSKKNGCKFSKYYYRAKEANEQYHNDLISARIGINIPIEIIDKINEVITPLIKNKKQTVNQVYINHPDLLYFSKSEFYKLVNDGYLNIINLDLPRKVKYSKRKNKVRRTREESLIRIGRTYDDYNKFVKENNVNNTTQLDTVEGEKGGKVFLTITLVKYQLMFIYLLDKQDSENVSNRILWIRDIVGDDLYTEIFFCTLTDNGKEFYQPEIIENIDNIKKCNVFYCDPSSPWQKGTCEENHHYIRYVLPKEVSTFDNLTEEDCNFLMSNINNIPREVLNGKTPYEAVLEIITEEQLLKLGIKKIDKDDVSLSNNFLQGRGKRNE